MEFSSLSFSSIGNTLEEVLQTLAELDEANAHQFPSDDIRHIYKTVASRKKLTRRVIDNFFKGDLDTYFSAISGASSWGWKALEWPFEKRKRIANYLSQEFFERHPRYLPVRRWITEANTPELYRDFVLHEEMRVNVLALIRLLDQLEGR